jgi:hypothetical protein
MIREYLKKRRTRKTGGEFIDKNVVEAVLEGKLNADLLQLKPAAMELIVAVVRGDTPQVVAERMGCVVDVATKNNAMILDMVSSMVIVAYGIFPQPQWGSGNRLTLVQELTEQLREDVKIIHCARRGVYGNLGSRTRMSYSFVVPGFVEMLGLFVSMNFGETRDLGDADA